MVKDKQKYPKKRNRRNKMRNQNKPNTKKI